MHTNVNLEAAVGVLAFLGTAFVLGLAAIIVLHAIKTRRRMRARTVSLAALTLAGCYLLLMLAFSAVSREKVLASGVEKHFCEIDCHLAYSITNVERMKTVGLAPNEATAKGVFYVVTIRTRFDETTISRARGDALLWPNSREVVVFDAEENVYGVSMEGERALQAAQGAGTPLETPLRPGESYTTDLVFDLPANVVRPEMLMRDGDLITHFIIGHENSFWHGKTVFSLES